MSSWLATRVGSPRMDRLYTVSERLDFALIVGYERVVITFLKWQFTFKMNRTSHIPTVWHPPANAREITLSQLCHEAVNAKNRIDGFPKI